MKKYFVLFQMHWQNSWVYPVSFVFWRLRQFLATFAALTVWLAIYQRQNQAFGYSREQMVSYIFLTGFLQSIILATQSQGLGDQIYTGAISNLFIKPMRVFGSMLTQEVADKLQNFVFVVVETILLILIFHPVVTFPAAPIFLVFLASAILGAILLFVVMLLFGTMGFWSPDTWGPRFLFYMFIDFTAGKLYPLSIFPQWLQNTIFFTPFPYLSYVQTQIFLGRYSQPEILRTFIVLTAWIVGLFLVFNYYWQKGLKEYGAVGR